MRRIPGGSAQPSDALQYQPAIRLSPAPPGHRHSHFPGLLEPLGKWARRVRVPCSFYSLSPESAGSWVMSAVSNKSSQPPPWQDR